MRDIKTQENDLDSFKFVFLELAKFTDQKEELKTITQKWAYFSMHATKTSEEDLAQIIGSDTILEKAYHELDRFGWSKEELMEYESVDMKMSSVKGALEEAYEEGKIITLKKTLQNMDKAGIKRDMISEKQGLNLKKLRKS